MTEWPKVHDWKSCVPQGTEGSNPSLSAGFAFGEALRESDSNGITRSALLVDGDESPPLFVLTALDTVCLIYDFPERRDVRVAEGA